jgi:hypothetical protein
MILSPHDPGTLLMGANKLMKSTDGGHSWAAMSPDLTAQIDRETLSLMGVPAKDIALAKNDGVSAFGTITTIAESPKTAGVYYTGADDGTVSVSRDGGKNWTNLGGKFPGLPKGTAVSRVAPSAFEEGVVYATFDGHREDDYAPYVYASSNFGQTWRSIAGDLPTQQTIRCITEDPKNANVLYLGTEFGLFTTIDKGQHWIRMRGGLPTVPVAEITIHPRDNDMLVATHGRSIWILDDLAPIQHAAEALSHDAWLFPARPAMSFFDEPEDRSRWMGDRPFWGRNPPHGAIISYYLKRPAKDVRLSVRDASGADVADLGGEATADARAAGINRLVWDLRHQALPLPHFPGQFVRGPTTYFADPLRGPFVLPGEYRVTLTVDGREAGTTSVRVDGDRAVEITGADRRAWHDTTLELHELERTADKAGDAVAALGDEIATLQRLAGPGSPTPEPVRGAFDAIAKKLADLRVRFGVPTPGGGGGRGGGGRGNANRDVRARITAVKTQMMASTSAPTANQAAEAKAVADELAKAVADLNAVIGTDVPSLVKTLGANSYLLPPLAPIKPIAP